MIHPFTLACALLAVGSGAWVYQSKHSAQMLDRDINRTMKAVDDARSRAGMLRAEYALLNDPSRLQDLAEHHLALKTTAPVQFTRLADLSGRLPAIGSFMPAEADAVDQPAAVQMTAAAVPPPEQAAPAASPTAAPRARLPTRAASPTVAVAALVAPPAAPAPVRASPTPRLVAVSAVERVPLPPFEQVAAAPRSARVAAAYAPAAYAPTAYAPSTYRAPTYAVPTYAATGAEAIARVARSGPVNPPVAVVASALGMARSMAATSIAGTGATYDSRGGSRN